MMEIPALLVASLEVQTRLGDIHKYLFKYISYNVFKGSVLKIDIRYFFQAKYYQDHINQ